MKKPFKPRLREDLSPVDYFRSWANDEESDFDERGCARPKNFQEIK